MEKEHQQESTTAIDYRKIHAKANSSFPITHQNTTFGNTKNIIYLYLLNKFRFKQHNAT